MKLLKLIAVLALGGAVSACSTMPDITSRNAPFETTPAVASTPDVAPAPARVDLSAPAAVAQTSPLRVTTIDVDVPRTLTVSEANLYYPRKNIVWRGDPIGDRHAQVQAIFETAFAAGTAGMNGNTDVMLEVTLKRFHSLTEKARYSVGGVHNMVFDLTVRRASTGEIMGATREIKADLPALGGRAAIASDQAGQTQKVRVTDFLTHVIQQELARFVAG